MSRIVIEEFWETKYLNCLFRCFQDIVNAALYFNSTRVHRLPCAWNLQLGDNANYTHCLFNDRVGGVQ